MSKNTKIKFGVLPYDDGSGDRFKVSITPKKDGNEDEIEIRMFSDTFLTMTVREWTYLKKAVDDGVTSYMRLQTDLAKSPETE